MEIDRNYLLFKESNRQDMNFSDMAYAVLDPSWNARTCSPFTRVYMVTAGYGELTYADKTVELLPWNIYIVPAELDFTYACPQYMEKLFFHLNLLRYNRYDLLAGYPEVITLTGQKDTINRAVTAFRKGDVSAALTLKSILYDIVTVTLEQAGVNLGAIETYSAPIKKAMRLIERQLSIGVTAEWLAAQLYLSPGQLQKQFKREVGVPLGKYIGDQVLFAAERLLRTTADPISTISEQLGFCDQFYFSRRFTARYGVPPTVYRKEQMRLE